jgi:chromatin remodeling complex protein RSC6
MAPTKKSTKTAEPVQAEPEVAAPVAAPAPAAKPAAKKSSSTKTEAKPAAAPAVAPAAAKSASKKSSASTKSESTKTDSEAEHSGEEEIKQRRKADKSSLNADFDALKAMIDAEITAVTPVKTEAPAEGDAAKADKKSASKKKVKRVGVKALKSIRKLLERMHMDYIRINKLNRGQNRANTKSGLQLQVPISKEMTKFAGLEAGKNFSRVEVNAHVCKYIEANNLKYKEDGRIIFPDDKLKALLNIKTENRDYHEMKKDKATGEVKPTGRVFKSIPQYKDTNKEGKEEWVPLTFFRLTSLMSPHFISQKKETA